MRDHARKVDGASQPERNVHTILSYHHETKHHLNHYARGPGGLDWANQPDPFRTFTGAPSIDLPLLADGLATRYADLYDPTVVRRRRPSLETAAVLLELSLGLSAWKEYRGNRWAAN